MTSSDQLAANRKALVPPQRIDGRASIYAQLSDMASRISVGS